MQVDVDGCLFQVGWDEEISDCGEDAYSGTIRPPIPIASGH